jgi:hypothetical protein
VIVFWPLEMELGHLAFDHPWVGAEDFITGRLGSET